MLSFSLIRPRHFVSRDALHLCVLQNLSLKSFSNISESRIQLPQVVDYLVNSCGLSPETAASAANKIYRRFHSTKNPDSVLEFFESIGFQRTHITKLFSGKPQLLLSSVDDTLKPKLKPFQDLGLSSFQLAKVIASNPGILVRSLRTQIIPSLNIIATFVGTGENMLKALKRSKWILSANPALRLQPNIDFLRSQNVPDSRIAHLMMTQPGNLMLKPDQIKETVETLKGLGFQPESRMFTIGIHTLGSMSKSTQEAKIKLLKDLGWSEEQIFTAFKKCPIYMACSEKKLRLGVEFYANALNWDASIVSRYPRLLLYSIKERIIPRVEVCKMLISKGILLKESTLVTACNMTEKDFLMRYVKKYEDKVPELMKVYEMQSCDDKVSKLLDKIY